MSHSDFDRIRKGFIEDRLGSIKISEQTIVFAEIIPDEPDATKAMMPPSLSPAVEDHYRRHLGDILKSAKKSPTLGAYIREKAHQCDRVTYRPALFEQGQISRDYWSKLLNNEVRASKEKLMRVAVLLQLSAEEAEEMLGKAGYSLSPAILRDVVVEYCLEEQYYDFVGIEQLLADHEIQSLFNDRSSS